LKLLQTTNNTLLSLTYFATINNLKNPISTYLSSLIASAMGNSCSGSKKIVVDGEQAREIVTEANNFIKETGGTGLHFTKLQVIHLAQKFKNKGMGDSLSREEFQTMFALENASLNILFDAFDLDGSGSLDLSEMIAGFR